jgi:hypothetical protein
VETASETERLLAETDPEYVGLVFDTGHFAYGDGGCERVMWALERFGPRIGATWRPAGIADLVVRGGYGIFFDTVPAGFDTARYAVPVAAFLVHFLAFLLCAIAVVQVRTADAPSVLGACERAGLREVTQVIGRVRGDARLTYFEIGTLAALHHFRETQCEIAAVDVGEDGRFRIDSRLGRTMAAKLVVASGRYDLPAYEKITTLKVWQEVEPPKGTLYHYPNPHNHQKLSIAASPAPPRVAQQIYSQATLTKMCLRYSQGEAMEKTLAWAEGECEGFIRSSRRKKKPGRSTCRIASD